MGTIYRVACKKCKVSRDLDKLYGLDRVSDRKEALEFSEYLEGKELLYREGLLLSFMAEHMNHDVVFFNEHSSCQVDLDPFFDDNEYKEDAEFWTTP